MQQSKKPCWLALLFVSDYIFFKIVLSDLKNVKGSVFIWLCFYINKQIYKNGVSRIKDCYNALKLWSNICGHLTMTPIHYVVYPKWFPQS